MLHVEAVRLILRLHQDPTLGTGWRPAGCSQAGSGPATPRQLPGHCQAGAGTARWSADPCQPSAGRHRQADPGDEHSPCHPSNSSQVAVQFQRVGTGPSLLQILALCPMLIASTPPNPEHLRAGRPSSAVLPATSDGVGVVSAAKHADEACQLFRTTRTDRTNQNQQGSGPHPAPDHKHCVQACLGWVQEWNTGAPNCHAAHAVLHAIVSTHSPQVSKPADSGCPQFVQWASHCIPASALSLSPSLSLSAA